MRTSIEYFTDVDGDMEIANLVPLRESGTEYFLVVQNHNLYKLHCDELERYLSYGNQEHVLVPAAVQHLDDLAYWLLTQRHTVSVREPDPSGGEGITARVFIMENNWDSFSPSYRHFHYKENVYMYSPDGYYEDLARVIEPGTNWQALMENHCDELECLNPAY